MTFHRKLVLTVSILAVASGSPAFAGLKEWGDVTAGQESAGWPNDGYGADNGAQPNDPIGTGIGRGSTAAGKYQILIGNFAEHGYIEPGASDWDQAVFTEKATSMGVNSYNDLLMTDAGISVQESMAGDLAMDMWGDLNGNATAAIGQTINGITINEAGMLGGSWFLGPGAMNTWADGGFTAEALLNLDKLDQVLELNGFDNVYQLQNYLEGRMEDFEGVDISEITDGTYTPGEGGSAVAEALVECAMPVNQQMQQQANAYVEGITAAAQDDTMGFSQMQQSFGEMSCIDFAFTGGMDVLFSVPSVDDIANQAMSMACNQVNQMVAEQTSGLTGQMQELASALSAEGANMGPLGNFGGVTTSYNQNGSGINFGTTSGGGPGGGAGGYGGMGGGGGVNSDPADGGFEGLFVQG